MCALARGGKDTQDRLVSAIKLSQATVVGRRQNQALKSQVSYQRFLMLSVNCPLLETRLKINCSKPQENK